jgi:hypothetical protein
MALPSNSWQFSSSLQTRKKSEAVLGDGFFCRIPAAAVFLGCSCSHFGLEGKQVRPFRTPPSAFYFFVFSFPPSPTFLLEVVAVGGSLSVCLSFPLFSPHLSCWTETQTKQCCALCVCGQAGERKEPSLDKKQEIDFFS